MNQNKKDNIISTVALILAVLSLVNFQKVLLIVQLILSVIVLIYAVYKMIVKDAKIPMFVFSLVAMLNSILWIIFIYSVYETWI